MVVQPLCGRQALLQPSLPLWWLSQLAGVHFQPVAPKSQTPLHSQLEYYGLGSQPGSLAFHGQRQQPLTAMPPSEERG